MTQCPPGVHSIFDPCVGDCGLLVPPSRWPETVQRAFWTAVKAPTHTQSSVALLAFVHELAEMQREWAHGPRWVTALEQSAADHVAALIDPKVAE